jgi:hypothetical protein
VQAYCVAAMRLKQAKFRECCQVRSVYAACLKKGIISYFTENRNFILLSNDAVILHGM